MKKVVAYIAFDGTSFGDERACIDYEKEKCDEITSEYALIDINGDETDSVASAWFVKIYTLRAYNFLYENKGFQVESEDGHNPTGLYLYSHHIENFVQIAPDALCAYTKYINKKNG